MNGGKIKSFTDLNAWKEAHKLLLMVYKVTREFPKEELFCLVSQMRRSALSVTSNIAEGFGRKTFKEKIQFYYHSQGSLIELKNQILASKDIGYLNNVYFDKLAKQANISHQLLQGLITKSKTYIIHKS